MNTPESINIAGHEVRVVRGDDLATWGQYRHDTKEIVLNSALHAGHPQLLPTLAHEVAHAVSYLTGIHWALFDDNTEKEEAFAQLVELHVLPALQALMEGKPKRK